MLPLSMALSDLWPDFKVTTFFELEKKYRKKGAYERQSYYCTIGNYTLIYGMVRTMFGDLTYKRVA